MKQNKVQFTISVNAFQIGKLILTKRNCNNEFQKFLKEHNYTPHQAKKLQQLITATVKAKYRQQARLQETQFVEYQYQQQNSVCQIYQPQISREQQCFYSEQQSRRKSQHRCSYQPQQNTQQIEQQSLKVEKSQKIQSKNKVKPILSHQKSLKNINRSQKAYDLTPNTKDSPKKPMSRQLQYQLTQPNRKPVLLKDHIFFQDTQKKVKKNKISTNTQVFQRLYKTPLLSKSIQKQPQIQTLKKTVKKIKTTNVKAEQAQFHTKRRFQTGSSHCDLKAYLREVQKRNSESKQKQKSIRKRILQQKGKVKQTSIEGCKRHNCTVWQKFSKKPVNQKFVQTSKKIINRQYQITNPNTKSKKNYIITEDLFKQYQKFKI